MLFYYYFFICKIRIPCLYWWNICAWKKHCCAEGLPLLKKNEDTYKCSWRKGHCNNRKTGKKTWSRKNTSLWIKRVIFQTWLVLEQSNADLSWPEIQLPSKANALHTQKCISNTLQSASTTQICFSIGSE